MAGKKETKSKYQLYIPQAKKIPDWYKNFNFVLVNSMRDLEEIFSGLEEKSYYMSFDTETTGLNFEELELVGYSFCLDGKTAYYVPVYHFEYKGNLGEKSVKFIYEKMCGAKKVFMFNARYDMRVLEYYGFKNLSDEDKKKRFRYVKYDMSKVDYFDVAVSVWAGDTNWKMPSLKASSLRILGIEQIHFDEVIEEAGNFFYLDPSSNPDTVFYAAADALCTYLLVPATMKYFNEGGLATKVDNKVLYPLMHYEAEKMYLEGDRIDEMLKEATAEVDRLEKEVYDMIGYQINLNSPIQVAQAFQRLGIDTGERTESGNMATGMKVLENLSDEVKDKYPALKSFVKYKETFKLVSSYLSVFKKIYENKGYLRGAYQNTNVPTGRLSAGKDGKNTFFSPVNVQALPKPHVMMYDVFDMGDMNLFSKKDNILLGYKFVPAQYHIDENGNKVHTVPTDDNYIGWAEGMDPHLNVRSLITPRFYEDSKDDDYVYVAADYAAQEIRLTTNISRESVWMKALTSGGDVHRSTAEALWGKENYNKDLRKRAKGCFSINSLLYTSNGAERCLDIQQGTLLDLNGNEQEFGYVIEDRDGYEIELSNGMTFEVTKDHKFLVLDSFDKRWITADEVTEGTQLGIKPMERFGDYQTVYFEGDFKNDAKFVKFDEDLAYLCGLYLGDGYVQPDHNYFSIVVKGDNLEYVEDILGRYGNPRISDMDKSKDWYVLVLSKKQFCDWIANTFGVKKDKHINDLVYKSPKSVMMGFLAGMLDSDSKIMGSIEYQSTVKSLCNDFGILASFLGYTMLSINENHSKWKGKTVNYYVARMAYEEKVKDIPIRLSKSIKDLNNRKTSFIGYSILESEREKFKQLGTYKDRGNFTDGRARRLARGISEKIGDWRYEYIPVEVKSKKEKKIKAFIMECRTHYFVGNGIISRNCNFGIIYGMGAPSLVDEKYGIHTLEQAQEFFEQYKNALPELFQWIDRVQRRARRNGTVYTYFGRPRRVKGYYDAGNAGFANRTAVNTQIQGCHLYHNLVLTDKGYKQIGRLYDEFESIHEDMNKWDYRVWNGFEMCDFFPVERGKDVKYRLHFSNGAVVECDSRHKVKVMEKEGSYKWVDVNDLVEGKDYVCFQKGITYQCTKNEDGSVVEDYTYHIITRVEKTDEEVQTYTLCVLNYLHQYVCEEMISKNTAGDILKIVMCRLWDNLLNNPKYRDDVRFMITIHDEIGYSVKASRAHEIMDLIEKNQTIVLKEWPVPIITEASCGWSVGGLFAFEKVKDDNPLGFKYYPKLD